MNEAVAQELRPVPRICQRCGFKTVTGAFNCVECGRKLPEVSYSTSVNAWQASAPATQDAPSTSHIGETVEAPSPSANKFIEGGWWGCAVILLVPIVIGVLAMSFLSGENPKPKQVAAAPPTISPAQAEMPSETEIVSECDIAVQNALVSESSYSPAWEWKYKILGNEAGVLRKYEATNGFGAKISATYNCKFDTRTKQIESLQTIDAYGLHTLIGQK